jgi:hypothetical protein
MDVYAHMAKWGDDWRQGPPDFMPRFHPDDWSLVTLRLRNPEEVVAMNLNAGRGLLPHLLTKMRETGFLTIWNDAETAAFPAERIVSVAMTKLDKNK